MADLPRVSAINVQWYRAEHRSLGGRIALGSDFPVESIDPLRGFYAAVTRLAEDGTSPHGADGWSVP